jgi:hypothetical protein
VELHGWQFVQYAGLLAMAHEKGLQSLSAHFISVTSELALAEATAEFSDGKTFMECADATPGNVGAKVKLHFARMALTRAKAQHSGMRSTFISWRSKSWRPNPISGAGPLP